MIKYFTGIILFLMPLSGICQDAEKLSLDSALGKNICRLSFYFNMIALHDKSAILFSYERKIATTITAVVKVGPAISIKKFGSSGNPYQYTFYGYGSADFRHYFNLRSRSRKGKTIKNYSGKYISLNQSFLSNPFLFLNRDSNGVGEGIFGSYIDLGWQRQYKKVFLHAFICRTIYLRDLGIGNRTLSDYHGGFTFGLVL